MFRIWMLSHLVGSWVAVRLGHCKHISMGCLRLGVAILEWARYLLSPVATLWETVWTARAVVLSHAGLKYNCDASAETMAVFTPLVTASSILVLLLAAGYLSYMWCASLIEAASLQIGNAMRYRRAQRLALNITTTFIIGVVTCVVFAA